MGRMGSAMHCSARSLSHLSLCFGLIATGALALAIATDFWLFVNEFIESPSYPDPGFPAAGGTGLVEHEAETEGTEIPGSEEQTDSTIIGKEEEEEKDSEGSVERVMVGGQGGLVGGGSELGGQVEEAGAAGAPGEGMVEIKMHAGLWRMCVIYEMNDNQDSGDEPAAVLPSCHTIAYFGQDSDRKEKADTANSILRAIRKSSPVIVCSLLIMFVALACSIVGSARRDVKTLVAAILYICSALCLAVGIIFYISAVNDEVSHRKKSLTGPSGEPVGFEYRYGWAFFFAGSSFVSAMAASVSNISLYLRRFPEQSPEDRRGPRGADGGRLIEPGPGEGAAAAGGGRAPPQQQETMEQMYVPRRSASRLSITTPV